MQKKSRSVPCRPLRGGHHVFGAARREVFGLSRFSNSDLPFLHPCGGLSSAEREIFYHSCGAAGSFDGKSEKGMKYKNPIQLQGVAGKAVTITLKAIAVKKGMEDSLTRLT